MLRRAAAAADRRAAIDRYLILAGPTAANPQQRSAAGEHDRTDVQIDGRTPYRSWTLLRILCGQYKKQHGQRRVDGQCAAFLKCDQWRNDGVAAASSDRGPPTVLFYFKSEGRGPDLKKVTGGPGWLRYASECDVENLTTHQLKPPSLITADRLVSV